MFEQRMCARPRFSGVISGKIIAVAGEWIDVFSNGTILYGTRDLSSDILQLNISTTNGGVLSWGSRLPGSDVLNIKDSVKALRALVVTLRYLSPIPINDTIVFSLDDMPIGMPLYGFQTIAYGRAAIAIPVTVEGTYGFENVMN